MNKFLTMKVVTHWNRLLKEVLESPSLEVLRAGWTTRFKLFILFTYQTYIPTFPKIQCNLLSATEKTYKSKWNSKIKYERNPPKKYPSLSLLTKFLPKQEGSTVLLEDVQTQVSLKGEGIQIEMILPLTKGLDQMTSRGPFQPDFAMLLNVCIQQKYCIFLNIAYCFLNLWV